MSVTREKRSGGGVRKRAGGSGGGYGKPTANQRARRRGHVTNFSQSQHSYLKKGWYNVVVVDWSALCAGPWYSSAVGNSQVCGDYLALFLDYLIDSGMPLSNLHVIGFSLGAEVAGFTGRAITSGKLPRITGLDPAYPEYGRRNALGRLNTLDAEFVDVIHTDSGQLGFPNPIGHIDFFPNGGRRTQPGCDMVTLLKRGVYEEILACGHMRAWKYYAESVNNEMGFPAVQCKNWLNYKSGMCIASRGKTAFMGFAASKHSRGKYYLATNSQPPFAKEDRLRRTVATNSQPPFTMKYRPRRTLVTNSRPLLSTEDHPRRTLATNSRPSLAVKDHLRRALATNIRPSLATKYHPRRTLVTKSRPSLATEDRPRRALATNSRPSFETEDRPRRGLATNSRPSLATEDHPRRGLAANSRPSLAKKGRLRRALTTNSRPSLAKKGRLRRALATNSRPSLATEDRPRRALATNSRPLLETEDRPRRGLATNSRPSLATKDRPRRGLATNSRPSLATEDHPRCGLATSSRPSLAKKCNLRRALYRVRTSTMIMVYNRIVQAGCIVGLILLEEIRNNNNKNSSKETLVDSPHIIEPSLNRKGECGIYLLGLLEGEESRPPILKQHDLLSGNIAGSGGKNRVEGLATPLFCLLLPSPSPNPKQPRASGTPTQFLGALPTQVCDVTRRDAGCRSHRSKEGRREDRSPWISSGRTYLYTRNIGFNVLWTSP
uniref:Lipase domain-containing protein n=1 Tax=Timema douglasi TaxID=61478 RepID=A0A7R8Z6U6_TIMDO|nr:unnamed protein product [Timema douglasi]